MGNIKPRPVPTTGYIGKTATFQITKTWDEIIPTRNGSMTRHVFDVIGGFNGEVLDGTISLLDSEIYHLSKLKDWGTNTDLWVGKMFKATCGTRQYLDKKTGNSREWVCWQQIRPVEEELVK